MGFSCGIVGLPNVGKSTLFNALTRAHADAQNFPFCTIDPNVGIVAVPDRRLEALAPCFKSELTVPTTLRFVDIENGIDVLKLKCMESLSHSRQNVLVHEISEDVLFSSY